MDYSSEIAKASLSIGAIKLQPENPFTWASGYKMPIYNDNRQLLTQHRGLVVDALIDIINKNNISFDAIAGIVTAGIPHAASLAQRLDKPMIMYDNGNFYEFNKDLIKGLSTDADVVVSTVPFGIIPGVMLANEIDKPFNYVRPAKKRHGLEKQTEGGFLKQSETALLIDYFMKESYADKAVAAFERDSMDPAWKRDHPIKVIKVISKNLEDMLKPISVEGMDVLMVEDLISTGGSSAKEALLYRSAKANVNYMLCAFNYGLDKAIEEFGILGPKFKVFSALMYPKLLDSAIKTNYLKTNEQIGTLQFWRADPFNWYCKTSKKTPIINADKSIIPACDVETIEEFEEIVKATYDLPGIGAYKLGFELGLYYGLPAIAKVARKYTNKPLTYDHQKAGTDIPDTGKNFAKVCKRSGIDSIIIFPEAGNVTQENWIQQAMNNDLKVITGGWMTHKGYLLEDGGYIPKEAALRMFAKSAEMGITNFVVPGNKPEAIREIRELVVSKGVAHPVFYAPGLVAQGGKIETAAKEAGNQWHAIIGRGIYEAIDIRKAALEYTKALGY